MWGRWENPRVKGASPREGSGGFTGAPHRGEEGVQLSQTVPLTLRRRSARSPEETGMWGGGADGWPADLSPRDDG